MGYVSKCGYFVVRSILVLPYFSTMRAKINTERFIEGNQNIESLKLIKTIIEMNLINNCYFIIDKTILFQK